MSEDMRDRLNERMEDRLKTNRPLLTCVDEIEALGLCPGYDRSLLEAAFAVAQRIKAAQEDVGEIVKQYLCG